IAVTGSRPLLLNVHNNLALLPGSTLDVSGVGANAVAGGGAGGLGQMRPGPAGGKGAGGAGGIHGNNRGGDGTSQNGSQALDGLPGLPGATGFGLATGGGAGAAGFPRPPFEADIPGGSVGVGGAGGVTQNNNYAAGGK